MSDFFDTSSTDSFFGTQEQPQVATTTQPAIPPAPETVTAPQATNAVADRDPLAEFFEADAQAQQAGEDPYAMTDVAAKLGVKPTVLKEQTLPDGCTLDESPLATLKREFGGIGRRALAVLLPCLFLKKNLLSDSDLFGPLLFALIMGIFNSIGFSNSCHDSESEVCDNIQNSANAYYGITIICFLGGSLICGLNSLVIGGSITISQTMCLMGYAMLPLAIFSIVNAFVGNRLAILIMNIVGVVWGIIVSVFFLNKNIANGKKPLAVFPIALIFIGLAVANYEATIPK